jgi:hypothetical protein
MKHTLLTTPLGSSSEGSVPQHQLIDSISAIPRQKWVENAASRADDNEVMRHTFTFCFTAYLVKLTDCHFELASCKRIQL